MNNQQLLDNLQEGDYVAFAWKDNILGNTIIVDQITSINEDQVLVHFLYGHSGEAEWIKKEDILAIGITDRTRVDKLEGYKLQGWRGRFYILNFTHHLIREKLQIRN